MATNCGVSVLDSEGQVHMATCHWDGYFSEAGTTLITNYNDFISAMELVDKGNMSVLGSSIEKCKFYNEPKSVVCNIKDWTENFASYEYNYIMIGGIWFVYGYVGRNFTMLEELV